MSNKIVIYKSKSKAGKMTLLGLVLGVAGWLFIRYTHNEIAGWSFFILATMCIIFGLGTLFDRRPYIVLTENGITEMSYIREEVEWDAILQVEEFYYRGQHFIRLLTSRDYKIASIRPSWFYLFDRIYAQEGVRAIFLRIAFLDVNSYQLTGLINRMISARVGERKEILNKFRETNLNISYKAYK